MKAFNRIFVTVIAIITAVFVIANITLLTDDSGGRPYLVEISRLVHEIEKNSLEITDLANCDYVTRVSRFGDTEDFYNSHSDYVIREIGGTLYRFDYRTDNGNDRTKLILNVNTFLGIMAAVIIAVMIYIKIKILMPFEKLTDVPYQLSKGNLTAPVKETKNRFFGRFIWGVDMLRENIEQQKQRELDLQKDKKTLLLSLSHDIKTPLSAIKLYSKALSKGLYTDREKQLEIAESIHSKADEIESYVTQIISASREDFLSLEVNISEFYLSELVNRISIYYTEKLSLNKTEFIIDKFSDCLISGDPDRSTEVIQNITENAVKYGDGRKIHISFAEEDGCVLMTVSNSGCTLPDSELPHIFDSFWRGSNSGNRSGSGLGLYICRQLMHKMNGDIFARINGDLMNCTAVFPKS